MLSRRDKLLVQPWEDRRYRDHRNKVRSATAVVDTSAPPARPHVAVKLKKRQRELERSARVQRDNFGLLQRLRALMTTCRLDNRWTRPLPNFRQKVGQYFDAQAAPPPARPATPPVPRRARRCDACARAGEGARRAQTQ